jgi:hypothetical protein
VARGVPLALVLGPANPNDVRGVPLVLVLGPADNPNEVRGVTLALVFDSSNATSEDGVPSGLVVRTGSPNEMCGMLLGPMFGPSNPD